MEEELEVGRMEGMELFFLNDNSAAEAVYYRGESSDKEFFEFMLHLVYLELRGCFRLHIFWVSGTRQIASGVDGFSRGCLTDGISSYGSILDFVCLNGTSFDYSASLLLWVQTYIGVNYIEPLTSEGWLKECHALKGGNNNDDGILMPYHYKDTF